MRTRASAFVVFLAVIAVVLGYSMGAWAETASFVPCENALDGARYRHTATRILAGPFRGKVIVVGGDSESSVTPLNPSSIYSTCFMFDPDVNSFSPIAALNIPRTMHSAIALPDGRILIAGGFNGTNDLSSCELYDPMLDKWTIAAYLGTARSSFTMTMLYTGYVLTIGGSNNGNAIAGCEIYDVNADSWTATLPLASARYSHAAMRMLDGRILVAGGNRAADSANNTYQVFTPPTNAVPAYWTPPATMPFTFDSYFQAVYGLLQNGDIVIGASNSGGRSLRFNGTVWSQAGTVQSRWGGTQSHLATNNIVEAGGWGNARVVDIYLPSANSWNTYNSIYGHTFAPIVLMENGKVLLVGGNSAGSSEIMTPSTISKPATVILKVVSPFGNPSPFDTTAYTLGTSVTCTIANTSFVYQGRTYTCVGYTGSGSCPSGSTTSVTFAISQNSSISWNWSVLGGTYRLTIVSPHGTPVPGTGINVIASGTTIIANVDTMVDTGTGVRYACIGWTGTGSVPTSGTTNSVTFDLNINSNITWLWRTEYRLVVNNPSGLGNPDPPVGDNWYADGTVINGSITSPYAAMQLAGYEGTGSLSNDIEATFSTVIHAPTTILWKWMELGQNKVSLAVNSAYGSPSPSGVTVHTQGDSVTASVPAFIENNGTRFECKGWVGKGSIVSTGTTNTTTFTIGLNSRIDWDWSVNYLLTIINIGSLGNPNPASGSYWLPENTALTASVTSPTGGYFCTGYSGVGAVSSSSSTSVGFILSGPTSITWNWVPISAVNTQLVIRSDYGHPTPPVGTSFFFSGAQVKASVERTVFGNPGEIFLCVGWTGGGSVGFQDTNPETGLTYFKTTGPEISITFIVLNADQQTGIPFNNTLTWNWERRYYLTVIDDPSMPRSIPPAGTNPITAGTIVTASVPPSADMGPGQKVFCIGFLGTGSVPNGTNNTITFTLAAPSSIEWLWELRYEVVVENPAGFGTPTPAAGTYYVAPGDEFTASISRYYVAHTCQGYFLTNLANDLIESEDISVTITVTEPVRITWRWDYVPLAWQSPIQVTTGSTEVPFSLSLARSPITSSPWIAYQDTAAKDLHVVYYSTDHFVNQDIDSFGDVGAFCSIKVDATGVVRTAYYDETNQILKQAERIAGVWNIQVVDDSAGNGRFCSINYSPLGKWGIAYLDNSDPAKPKIKYAEKFENDWLIEITKEFDGVIEYLSLAYYNEQPLIVFYDATSGTLKYLYYDAEWILDSVDPTPDVGRYANVAINPVTGHPAVVYYDLSNHRAKFAQRQPDFTWSISIIDQSGDVGYYPTLVFDKNGSPRVTYLDVGRQLVKFATFDGIIWQIDTMPTIGGGAALFPALAVLNENELSYIFVEDDRIYYSSTKIIAEDPSAYPPGSTMGCFVATAAFGAMAQRDVESLTSLRDRSLTGASLGGSLCDLYYALSPAIAREEAGTASVKAVIRKLLRGLAD
ncbi:MAG: CFI-box-CTERM domain-containing protein [Candidatus Brocadiia bacterium]